MIQGIYFSFASTISALGLIKINIFFIDGQAIDVVSANAINSHNEAQRIGSVNQFEIRSGKSIIVLMIGTIKRLKPYRAISTTSRKMRNMTNGIVLSLLDSLPVLVAHTSIPTTIMRHAMANRPPPTSLTQLLSLPEPLNERSTRGFVP